MGLDAVAVECHGCRAPIPAQDVEQRRVVIVLRKPYCHSCADQITTRRITRPSRGTYLLAVVLLVLVLVIAATASTLL